MSIEQTLPDKTAFLVEYPGYVRDAEAALDTLGGTEAVTTAASSDSSVLQLRFRPDDPYSHPLYAERQSTKGLLLKIARKVADPSEASVKAEVLACVHSKFTFSGMADYQYLPADQSSNQAASSSSAGPYGEETLPMLCIPPLFTKTDVPLDYAFKNFRASDRPASSKVKQPPWMIPYTAAAVPHAAADQGANGEDELRQAIQSILSTRPIWTQTSLAHRLPQSPQVDLEPQLQKLCYQFKDGPWRAAWIQRGHDPRQDPSKCKFQTLQYDLPQDWYQKTTHKQATTTTASENGQSLSHVTAQQEAAVAPTFEQLHRFEALPTSQSTVFQLCDLNHQKLQQFMQELAPAAECNSRSGWLMQADWDKLLALIQELFGRHLA